MSEPEPIPCPTCGSPMFPNLDYCSDECASADTTPESQGPTVTITGAIAPLRPPADHDIEVARKALTDAAKAALSDYAEGRTRGRLWHDWLRARAEQIGEN